MGPAPRRAKPHRAHGPSHSGEGLGAGEESGCVKDGRAEKAGTKNAWALFT